MDEFLELAGQVGGRMHPMVLHLPIGLVAALVTLELWWIIRGLKPERSLRVLLAWLTAVSAVAAAGSGLLLSTEGSYSSSDDTLSLHKWLGIACAAAFVVIAIIASVSKTSKSYRTGLVLSLALIVPVGHLGASMTHGPDFLWEAFRRIDPTTPSPTGLDLAASNTTAADSAIAAPHVHEFFQQYCFSCHGSTKQKGDLALDSPNRITEGGYTGPVLVAGDAQASLLIQRLRLPIDHDDRMPPRSKRQPSEPEIQAIERWINSGANLDEVFGPQSAPATQETSEPPTREEPAANRINTEISIAIAALRAKLAHVEIIDPATQGLFIDLSAAASSEANPGAVPGAIPGAIPGAGASSTNPPADEWAALLEPLKENIIEAKLRGLTISPRLASTLAACPRLEDLDLSYTKLDDASLRTIVNTPSLKSINLWNATLNANIITSDALSAIANPTISVLLNSGTAGGERSAILETEPPVALKRNAAAAPAATTSAAPTPSLAPINRECPVSGAPVNPTYAIVHQGRVIGFCCEKCALEFWKDPGKFASRVAAPQ
jgi:uncharacterized membrane protein/mono/diheme cytochrome c family protein